jgi:endoglucanase
MKNYTFHTRTLRLAWIKLLLLSLLACPLFATAMCLDQERLTGVNLAGAEFNSSKLPGTPYKDYTFPNDAELTYIAAQGANVIRLPFRWERIQPNVMSELAPAELKRLHGTVTSAHAKGLCVILDVHNYGKYFNQTLNGDAALQNAFVNLWQRLAVAFNDPKQTVFGLMNEPSYLPREEWASLAKRTLFELRNAGVTNMIFIAGGHWSGLHDWFSPAIGNSNATLFADVNDPLQRTILEVHQYADKDYSGTGNTCKSPDQFNAMFTKLSAWANANKQQFFLGEFGMPQNEVCLLVLERFLSLMTGPEWKGWAYWAAGGWWGKYPLAINTSATEQSSQWPILKRYFFNPSSLEPTPPRKSPPMSPQPRTRNI